MYIDSQIQIDSRQSNFANLPNNILLNESSQTLRDNYHEVGQRHEMHPT